MVSSGCPAPTRHIPPNPPDMKSFNCCDIFFIQSELHFSHNLQNKEYLLKVFLISAACACPLSVKNHSRQANKAQLVYMARLHTDYLPVSFTRPRLRYALLWPVRYVQSPGLLTMPRLTLHVHQKEHCKHGYSTETKVT